MTTNYFNKKRTLTFTVTDVLKVALAIAMFIGTTVLGGYLYMHATIPVSSGRLILGMALMYAVTVPIYLTLIGRPAAGFLGIMSLLGLQYAFFG